MDASVSSLDGAGDAVPAATDKKQQREKKGAVYDRGTHTPVIFALQSPMLQEKVSGRARGERCCISQRHHSQGRAQFFFVTAYSRGGVRHSAEAKCITH